MRDAIVAIMVLVGMTMPASAQAPKKLTYDEHIVPLFRDKCFACHNQDKKNGGLRLNTYATLMEGGSSGKIVEGNDPAQSKLFLVIDHQEQPNMPPKSPKLPPEFIATVQAWIEGGALENAGSKAVASNKPKVDFSLASASIGKPEGPPPMPERLPLEPAVVTPRAAAITAIASSPWAPLVAVAGQKQVILYHADTLDYLGVLPFPEGVPHVLKFSRNGSLLLAGGGRGAKAGRVVVWNVKSGERIFEVGEEYDTVLAADISSDQSKIALGGPGKMIRVYSTKDGQQLYEIKKHTDWVTALEFSPDGVLLATGDRNGGLFVWEGHNGREYFSLRGHTAAITDITWRADSNMVASASEDSTVRLWEMENGGQVKNWGAHGGGTLSLEFAHDGRLVSCGRDRVAKVWDQNGAQQRAFEAMADVATRTTFTHDAGKVIVGDWTGQLRAFATADGKPLGNLLANPPTVATRLDTAAKEVAAKKATADQLAAAATASATAAQNAANELAAAQKALTDAQAAVTNVTNAVNAGKANLDKANAAIPPAQAAVPPREAAAKLLLEASAKAKEAAEKVKDSKDLADFAAASQAAAAKAAADFAAAQKQVMDLTAAAKTATDQFAAAQAALQKAQADATNAPKVVEQKQAALKPAQDKAAADKAAADAAAAALKAAQDQVARWAAALSALKTAQAKPAQ